MFREIVTETVKGSLELLVTMKDLTLEGLKLLRTGWRFLLRKSYEKLTGTPHEDPPTLFEVLATLFVVISGLPQKQKWAAYAGCVAVVAAACFLVGSAFVSNNNGSGSSGSSSGGSVLKIGGTTYYQPEFSKLDCLTCGGDGDCNTCHGYGEVDRYAGAGDTVRSKCSSCYGSGNCRTCGGSGKR